MMMIIIIKCWAGGRCPSCTPPTGRPLAGGKFSSASPFGRLISIIINIAAAGAVDRELLYIEWEILFPPTATTAGTATATTTNNNNINNNRCGGRSHHWRWKLKISFCHVWLAMLSLRPALQLQSSLSWFCLGLVLWSRMRMMTENVSNFS